MTPEHIRLEEAQDQKVPWKKWGPYLSERQWGTVREDYSEGGDAWNYFSHDRRARAPIVGARMVWPTSPTTNSGSVSRWPCGMARTRSSRNACSG
jgi:hypothetical protein